MHSFQRPIIEYHFDQRESGLRKHVFSEDSQDLFLEFKNSKKIMKFYWQKLLKDIRNESNRSCSTYGGLIINNFHLIIVYIFKCTDYNVTTKFDIISCLLQGFLPHQ